MKLIPTQYLCVVARGRLTAALVHTYLLSHSGSFSTVAGDTAAAVDTTAAAVGDAALAWDSAIVATGTWPTDLAEVTDHSQGVTIETDGSLFADPSQHPGHQRSVPEFVEHVYGELEFQYVDAAEEGAPPGYRVPIKQHRKRLTSVTPAMGTGDKHLRDGQMIGQGVGAGGMDVVVVLGSVPLLQDGLCHSGSAQPGAGPGSESSEGRVDGKQPARKAYKAAGCGAPPDNADTVTTVTGVLALEEGGRQDDEALATYTDSEDGTPELSDGEWSVTGDALLDDPVMDDI